MLSHLRSHLAFGHAVRAREVELESIDASVLDHASQLLPAALFILLHDRGDQDMVWIIFLDLSKLVEPDVDWAIGDQLDVLKTYDFACGSGAEFSVTRNNIHDLRRFETDSFSDSATPAGIVRLGQHASICSRRSRTQHKRIGKLYAVDSD